jgi:hypothetical protein
MRNATRRLRNHAKKKGIAVIGIEHHNKTLSGSAQSRVTGSQAKVSMTRATWGVYDDPENDGSLLFARKQPYGWAESATNCMTNCRRLGW